MVRYSEVISSFMLLAFLPPLPQVVLFYRVPDELILIWFPRNTHGLSRKTKQIQSNPNTINPLLLLRTTMAFVALILCLCCKQEMSSSGELFAHCYLVHKYTYCYLEKRDLLTFWQTVGRMKSNFYQPVSPAIITMYRETGGCRAVGKMLLFHQCSNRRALYLRCRRHYYPGPLAFMEEEMKASSVPHEPDIVVQAFNHNT